MAQTDTLGAGAIPLSQLAVPAVLALLLGAFLLLGTGFSTMPALHNAAHDARHSFAFPCH